MRVCNLLGGSKVIKRPVRTPLEAHDMIADGLPLKALLFLVDRVQVLKTGGTLHKAIGFSHCALVRRKPGGQRKTLSTELGSRIWRFADILSRASDVLGDQKLAEAWLLEPALGLNQRRPIDLLGTAIGTKAIEDHIARMDYGIYC
ncbi:antitoxin Xre/MbcA/ParS toxin-binding domain-containing protein [Pseudophaeobacter sp. 1A16562]|uniref:antitoxin Xre/MbcA/ParS toxin-binding domain-containing protein n=1 Tax=Pseudophaeobacter sp. 1A16562 TaxID=3098143 RepID=UPI0034D5E5E9